MLLCSPFPQTWSEHLNLHTIPSHGLGAALEQVCGGSLQNPEHPGQFSRRFQGQDPRRGKATCRYCLFLPRVVGAGGSDARVRFWRLVFLRGCCIEASP